MDIHNSIIVSPMAVQERAHFNSMNILIALDPFFAFLLFSCRFHTNLRTVLYLHNTRLKGLSDA